MNIFNKIGNHLEKRKKERKTRIDKYWKLSASERIDYDNKLERINNSALPFFGITIALFKMMFWIAAFFYLISLYIGESILMPVTLLLASLFSIIGLTILVDIVLIFLSSSDKDKQKVQLNKRFKLI